ncbi:MAG TPA: hypothetical protein VLC09_03725 [Polyangiaceae bacterium]|nr:hypothetical protein [Polyangiaceae bacterium]
MKFPRFVLVVPALFLPSCLIYDDSLLGVGDDNPSSGGDAGTGGDGAGTGGTPGGTGGDIIGSGGGSPSGGTGGSGTGGEGPTECEARGTTADFTTLPTSTTFPDAVASVASIDNFDGLTANFTGNTGTFNGHWQTAVSNGANTSLTPTTAAWANSQDSCLAADNTSLHATGVGYMGWGASFNGELKSPIAFVDATGYDGIVFWARSGNAMQQSVRIDFADDVASVQTQAVAVKNDDKWRAYQVKFPASGVDLTKLRIVYISMPPVASATDGFDFWIDDISFYVKAP